MTPNDYDAGVGELHIASGVAPGVPELQAAGLEDAALAVATPRKEIVFIEDDVPDIGTLLGGIGRDKEVVILDSKADGLHQIAQALAGKSGIDAVHVFAHGQAGAVELGSLILDAGSLDTHKDDLQAIRQGMSAGGDILLYGCNVGADAGFVDRLAIATGADVAASNDLTGAAALGGNWNLEVSSGNIETAPAIDAHAAALYRAVLSISPGTLEFDHTAYFAPGVVDPSDNRSASTDVVYRVNNNAAYQLKIDGAATAVSAYTSYPGAVFAGATALESSLTFSFVGGQLFAPTAIAFANWSYSTSHTTENLVIRGYDASGHQVGSDVTYTLYPDGSGVKSIGLGGAEVKTLKVTAGSGKIDYLLLDSISIGSISSAPPAVAFVSSSTANGSYKVGDVIHIDVGFDQQIAVTGSPTLTLETGTTDRVVSYASGSGTTTLVFDYTVQAGDTTPDLDYLSTAALALNGGTIKASTGGTDATLTLPTPAGIGSLGANSAIVIDTTAPGAPSTPDLTAGTDTGTSSSDNVTKNTTPTFTGTAEAGSTVKLYDGATLVGSGTATGGNYSITASTLTDGVHVITAAATDAAGNVGTASSGLLMTIDTGAPTVSVMSNTAGLKAGETATITFMFSEDPGATFTWDGSAGDVTVSGGTLSAISGSGLTRTATFTPNANVDNGSASVGVTGASYADAAGNNGNAGTAATFGYDTKAPTLAISSDKASLHAGDTATITFTFSEDPGATFSWNGSAGDVAVSGG
ncbi:DUF4347 domain-containing protein, partial [Massilia sp. Root335]|uniref:DUF4347 domain-containing protein n=1 Tax=Massilia sp. Root335 TaxID=1736517 RepID=UPI00190FBFE4